jgi:hypothetical protein
MACRRGLCRASTENDVKRNDRWGVVEQNPSIERLRELLQSLDIDNNDHPDVALKHERKWCLSAYPGILLAWENAEADKGNARHMKCVPRDKILGLWLALAQRDLAAIEVEP